MRICVYDEGSCNALRVDEIAEQLRIISGVPVEVRPEFVRYWRIATGSDDSLTKRLAEAFVEARVVDPLARFQPRREATAVEVAAEQRGLEIPGSTSLGILYDGLFVQCLLAELLPAPALQDCHIVLTARLFGTWMAEDRRWHAHTVLLGEPAIISTSGLVQAPARPREYYQALSLVTSRLVPREVVEAGLQEKLADRMLRPQDPRLTQAVIGCALQAVVFHLTGEAFCSVPTCRLYNARTQEELVRCQCSQEAALCPRHETFFSNLRASPHS